MFSLKEKNNDSFPICLINKGDKNTQPIFYTKDIIDYEPEDELKNYDYSDLINSDMFKIFKKRRRHVELERFKNMMVKNQISLKNRDEFNKMSNLIKNKIKKEFKIKDGHIQPIPLIDTRDIVYVAGPSGAGKSTFCADYVKLYIKLYPKNDIFLFSRKNKDPVFDKIKKIKRILIDEELIEDPIHPEELTNTLCIFDDTDTFQNKKISKGLEALKNDLMELGRANNVNLLITSHLINDYKKTKTVLNELKRIVLFPNDSSAHSLKYCLQKYLGMTTEEIRNLYKLNSRWVLINQRPRCVIYEKGIYLLNNCNI